MEPGTIITSGVLERAIRNLLNPSCKTSLPEPSQEEIRAAIANLRPAYYKRAFLVSLQREQEGLFRPDGFAGVEFLHYIADGNTSVSNYSAEDLQLIERTPVYRFSSSTNVSSHLLYGLDNLLGKFQLWRAGVRVPS